MKSPAIVSYKPADGQFIWKLEEIEVREDLKPDEVLVEMVALGLCHTDIFVSTNQMNDTSILGHEGAGFVRKIGSGITHCNVGDPVVLSFTYCGACNLCKKTDVSYCEQFTPLNMMACESEGETFSSTTGIKPIGKFFGHSSFSKFSVVSGKLVVNVKDFNLTLDQLKLLSPLGCGFQTGAGSILNTGNAKEGETVAVYGLGGVGISAIMGAKIAGCSKIVAIDIKQSKLDLALKVGATHTILAGDNNEVRKKLHEITDGGPDLSFECIGGPIFVQNALDNAANKGRVVFVGVGKPEDVLNIAVFPFLVSGKQLIAGVEGDSVPTEFIPRLIRHYLKGEFPVEEIETRFPFADFEKALAGMKAGTVTKAILEF
ncbi:CIC11C00000003555 [Sungouiella intermedia]|uniref:CIC11C00000003555 n=1 Tax=Sungouiella intermedia TaxID=45354 RepID=A0A1L0DKI8_9ASCO|nr:CIC11C00000003555 [[Candida] intermedia]